ncbi:hypothetical protein NL676_000213 [Syzygium grande]|nr:hypothetical protein NL676_000213 [Syzygium grande]
MGSSFSNLTGLPPRRCSWIGSPKGWRWDFSFMLPPGQERTTSCAGLGSRTRPEGLMGRAELLPPGGNVTATTRVLSSVPSVGRRIVAVASEFWECRGGAATAGASVGPVVSSEKPCIGEGLELKWPRQRQHCCSCFESSMFLCMVRTEPSTLPGPEWCAVSSLPTPACLLELKARDPDPVSA